MRSIAFAIFILQTIASAAQQPWSIGARGHFGFLWAHRPSSWILVEGHAGAAEIFMERQVEGDRPWHMAYGMPRYGILAIHTRMANPEHIGDAVGAAPFITMPLVCGERLSFGLRMAWGVGYVAKPFDRRDNTRQIAIGSRINTAIQVMPELRYETGRFSLFGGISVNHWSNGSLKQPNLGLNFITASVGASYATAQRPVLAEPDRYSCEFGQREHVVVLAGAVSENGRPLNGQKPVFSLSSDMIWLKNRKGTWSVGADIFSKGDLATEHEDLAAKGRAALTQFGAHAGGALRMGQSELLFHFGAYIYSPVADDSFLFQRIGGRYRIGRHLIASACLKTHFATADHWEFGIGYRWN